MASQEDKEKIVADWYADLLTTSDRVQKPIYSLIGFPDLFNQFDSIGIDLSAFEDEYAEYDAKKKLEFITNLKWPGIKKTKTKKTVPTSDETIVNIRTEASTQAASAAGFLLGVRDTQSDHFKHLKAMGETFPGADMAKMRWLATTFLQVTATFAEDAPFGTVEVITTDQFNTWQETQHGKTHVVGALTLWPLLERLGIACSTINNGTRDVLSYERNGKKIHMYDRFMVHSDYEEFVEADEAEVNVFLERLKTRGNPIKYVRVNPVTYTVLLAYMTVNEVSATNLVLTTVPIKKVGPDSPYKNPVFLSAVNKLFDKISRVIAAGTIKIPAYKGDDVAIDALARWVDNNIPAEELVTVADLLAVKHKAVTPLADNFVQKFVLAAEKKDSEKLVAIRQLVPGSKGMPKSAVERLKYARELRNKGFGDRVNHNVGSVRANNLIEWVDTYHKGRSFVDLAKKNPLYATRTVDTVTVVYGVAYGHMTPLFNELRVPESTPNKLQFVDNKAAKGATEVFTIGDVFSHEQEQAWVFDDTNSHSLRSNLKDRFPGYTGDHYKVKRFIDYKSVYVVTKVSLKSFVTPAQMALWETLLVGNGYQWRVFKFGRLHNEECYLVGYQSKRDTKMATIRGDLASISTCVEVANDIIMLWQTKGLRAGHWIPSEDEPSVVDLKKIWCALVTALPVSWPWYYDMSQLEVKSIRDSFDEADYDDVLFEYDIDGYGEDEIPPVEFAVNE